MVNVDLYSAIIIKVSNALDTLVSGEKPGFQTLSEGLVVLLCAEVVRQRVPDHGPCTANARRPTVVSRCRGTTISCCVADLRRCLPTTSVTGVQQSTRHSSGTRVTRRCCGYLSEARCRLFAYGPADATASRKPPPLVTFKYRLVLLFWYRLTQVVLEKRPLNWCSSSNSSDRNIKPCNLATCTQTFRAHHKNLQLALS